MKIVFFGSSHFAVVALEQLLSNGMEICCVVTQPDKPKGRGMHVTATIVKESAIKAGITVFQPGDINSPESAQFLSSLNADLFVVIAYGQILSETVLSIPRMYPLNVHASLLPQYRGAAPISRALIQGQSQTGVSVMKMIKRMDAGPVFAKQIVNIEISDDALILEEKLAQVGAQLLLKTIHSIQAGETKTILQDEAFVTYAPKLKKEEGLIIWNRPVQEVYNLIRGCAGWPGAFTYFGKKMLKVHKAVFAKCPCSQRALVHIPGRVCEISKHSLTVATQDFGISLLEVQVEGKKKMGIQEFLAGHKLSVGNMLSES